LREKESLSHLLEKTEKDHLKKAGRYEYSSIRDYKPVQVRREEGGVW